MFSAKPVFLPFLSFFLFSLVFSFVESGALTSMYVALIRIVPSIRIPSGTGHVTF